MHDSRMVRSLHLVGNVATWVILLTVTIVLPCRAQDVATGDEVRVAWERRQQLIRTFQYECELRTTLLNAKRGHPLDPFADIHDKEVPDEEIVAPELLFYKMMKFNLDGDKIAYLLQGEHWQAASPSRGPYRFRAAFDGVDYKDALEHGRLPMGQVITNGTAGDSLTVGVNQVAFYLWFSPIEWLQSQVYGHEKMTVSKPHVDCDGRDCVEFSMPRGNPAWRGFVCVDPSRDYVPVRFIQQKNGVVKNSLSIRYIRDKRVGSVVYSWDMTHFSSAGMQEWSTAAQVTRYTVNKPLAASTFTFEFPAGTQVIEKDGANGAKKKFFVALAVGQRSDISGQEFGEIPFDKQDLRYVILKDSLHSLTTGASDEERSGISAGRNCRALRKHMRPTTRAVLRWSESALTLTHRYFATI